MKYKFSVGEVAVIAYTRPDYPEFLGRECTIIGLDPIDSDDDYVIEVNGLNPADYGESDFFTCPEQSLKKKPQKGEELEKIDWVKKLKLKKLPITVSGFVNESSN